ncbi:MAG: hypothetical protein A6F72_04410 [Cycloclasticus sp. symbiont of Poecilosclerida sp. N]|nr:MAG: hypothetical protein A6F72_04410 [Cycloclasticus sp. symbiont of Poecilosclerida sp. N]
MLRLIRLRREAVLNALPAPINRGCDERGQLNGLQINEANQCLKQHYIPVFNAAFSHLAREKGNVLVPLTGVNLNDYLCEQYERVVQEDNGEQFNSLSLQRPKDKHRGSQVNNATFSIFHRTLRLGQYSIQSVLLDRN